LSEKEMNILKIFKSVFDSKIESNEITICDLELSEKEKDILKQKFGGWSNHFIRNLKIVGIARLINEYKRLVMSCRDEKSYFGNYENDGSKENWKYGPGISYEYMNYVSCRTAIQIIIDSISKEKTEKICDEINEYDIILKHLVDENPKTFYKKRHKKYPEEIYWWYYKLPINVME
jgi:hypothetical protein